MKWHFVDQILEMNPGQSARGQKTFPKSSEIFEDHFPGFPILPGVLQIEMMAQLGGKCLSQTLSDKLPVLAQVKDAKFYQQVPAGTPCEIAVTVTKVSKSYASIEGQILVNSQKAASATILFGFVELEKLPGTKKWLESKKTSEGISP